MCNGHQCGGFFPAALARADQEHALQLLIFLLPPCNSDTLQRLLRMLSMVAAHADDSVDCEGQKVTEGCTAADLASKSAFFILSRSLFDIFTYVLSRLIVFRLFGSVFMYVIYDYIAVDNLLISVDYIDIIFIKV